MPITVRAELADSPHRWVRISLSPWQPGEDDRPIAYSNSFRCSIKPLDMETERYHLEIWEGALLSGLIFVFRRSSMTGVMLHSLEGQLTAEDMEGVAYAATAAGIIAAGDGIPTPANQRWVIKEV